MYKPQLHKERTKKLAAQLKGTQIYQWLITEGFFPESYVLPPCFRVGKYPKFGKIYTHATKHKYQPKLESIIDVQFPKTELAVSPLRVVIDQKHLPKILSLLLLLAELRIKAFPKVLGILEAIIKTKDGKRYRDSIGTHLGNYLKILAEKEEENRYLIAWIIYFLTANDLRRHMRKHKFKDRIVRSIYSNRGLIYKQCKDFKLFIGTKASSKNTSLLRHLDVFKPQ